MVDMLQTAFSGAIYVNSFRQSWIKIFYYFCNQGVVFIAMITKLSCQITLPTLLFTDASPTPSPPPDKAQNWCRNENIECPWRHNLQYQWSTLMPYCSFKLVFDLPFRMQIVIYNEFDTMIYCKRHGNLMLKHQSYTHLLVTSHWSCRTA